MGKYFGTDGFRGEANVTLTAEHAFALGRFLGWYFGYAKEGRVRGVIGKDTRRSSYMLEYAIAAGMVASGADAYLLHVTTTPSVSYVTRSEGFDFGVMISASHNPFYDNGIKLFGRSGVKLDEETLALAEGYLDGALVAFGRAWKCLPSATGEAVGRTIDHLSGRHRYMGYLISLASFSLSGYRIGLDCANGSTWTIAKGVFDALGATTYVVGATPNGVNINLDCGSTHIENLQGLVTKEGLDVGFAFDGDGDRLICVDEEGRVVDGDGVLYILARHLASHGALTGGEVVGTVMTNGGLEESLGKEDISLARTPVGDKYVYEYMAKHGSPLGGEPSGHVILSQYATTGDGILTALKVLEVMCERRASLATLVEGLHLMPHRECSVMVKDPKGVMTMPEVQRGIETLTKQLGDRGRLLIRASGTEPKIRVMCEGQTQGICGAYCNLGKALILKYSNI